jgi:hypothetical protein
MDANFTAIQATLADAGVYGNNLNTAVAAIGATKTTLVYRQDLTVTAGLTIPATLELMPMNGALIQQGAYTISYAGSTDSWGTSRIFGGTGNISGLSGYALAEWFGAVPDGTTECAPAIDQAVNCLSAGDVLLGAGVYMLGVFSSRSGAAASFIVPKSGVNIRGIGMAATTLRAATKAHGTPFGHIFTDSIPIANTTYADFTLDGGANIFQSGDTPSGIGFLGTTGGGFNNRVERVKFKNVPQNNSVAFTGGSGVTGWNTIRDSRFEEVGSGLTGNYCTDHTDIYCTGSNNKFLHNYHKSTNFVLGAAFEFHGDRGAAYFNQVEGYSMSYWVALAEVLTFTRTDIHYNKFLNVYSGGGSSSANSTDDFGTLAISNNLVTLASGGSSAAFSICSNGTFKKIIYCENELYGVPDVSVGLVFANVFDLELRGNTLENFAGGIRLNGSGGGLGDSYDYHEIIMQGNVVKNCGDYPVGVGASPATKIKTIVATGNTVVADTARGQYAQGMVFSGTPDGGMINSNSVSALYEFAMSVAAGYSSVMIEQLISPNWKIIGTNATGTLGVQMEGRGTAPPSAGYFSVGDYCRNINAAVGQPKGWRCTVAGYPGTWPSEGNL